MCCGAAVHIVAAEPLEIEVEVLGMDCECARKAARKLPKNGRCEDMFAGVVLPFPMSVSQTRVQSHPAVGSREVVIVGCPVSDGRT